MTLVLRHCCGNLLHLEHLLSSFTLINSICAISILKDVILSSEDRDGKHLYNAKKRIKSLHKMKYLTRNILYFQDPHIGIYWDAYIGLYNTYKYAKSKIYKQMTICIDI